MKFQFRTNKKWLYASVRSYMLKKHRSVGGYMLKNNETIICFILFQAIIYRSYGSYIFSNRFYSSYMYSRPIMIKLTPQFRNNKKILFPSLRLYVKKHRSYIWSYYFPTNFRPYKVYIFNIYTFTALQTSD